MNRPLFVLCLPIALIALHVSSLAQVSSTGGSGAAPTKLTSRDIKVLPFVLELKETKFKPNDKAVPEELRATPLLNGIRLAGKKRVDVKLVDQRPAGHFGKVVLLPPGERVGKLFVKVPSNDGAHIYYYTVLEFADALSTKKVLLKAGVNYDWSIKIENGQVVLRVLEGAKELVALSAPSDQVQGAGFGATLRYTGQQADLTVEY
jgi:hypothetical protein